MDSISFPEFLDIFSRTSDKVNFKGRLTEEAIDECLNEARERCLNLRRKSSTTKERIKLKREAIGYSNLINYGFAARTIQEARRNPNGIFALTLLHGKSEAKRLLLARKNTKIRIRRRNSHYPK